MTQGVDPAWNPAGIQQGVDDAGEVRITGIQQGVDDAGEVRITFARHLDHFRSKSLAPSGPAPAGAGADSHGLMDHPRKRLTHDG
jgi:hypothetical protein